VTSGEDAFPRSACTFPPRPRPPAAGKSGPGWARGKWAQEQGLAAMQNSQTLVWPHRIVQLALHWHSVVMQLMKLTGMQQQKCAGAQRAHTCAHTLTHTYTRTHTCTGAHSTQAHTRTDTHAHARTHKHKHTHSLSLAPLHTHDHTHIHTRTHAHTLAIAPKQHAKLAQARSSSSSSDINNSKSGYSFGRGWLLNVAVN